MQKPQTPKRVRGGNTINHAVDISFSPQNLDGTDDNKIDIETGRTGAFVLDMSVSHANDQTQPVTFKVKITDKDVRLLDFGEGNQYTPPYGNRTYTLETDEDGNRYITGYAYPGETFTQPFSFFYPNGVTPPTEVVVDEDDIEVVKPESMPGNILKEGGSINFIAKFEWEPVDKAVNVKEIPVGSDGKLSQDIVYTMTAKSKQNQRDKGGIFTKEYTMVDTMTLPEGMTFVEGTASLSGDGKSAAIGGVQAASFSKAVESIERVDDSTLRFTYKVTNDTLAERPLDSEDPKETPDLDFQFTAKAEAINIDFDVFDTKNKIMNEVDFNAVPCLEADEHNSSDEVPVVVSEIGKAFTVSKASAPGSSQLNPGGTILYTIKVKNDNPTPITVDIKDSIPANTSYIDGSATDGGQKSGSEIIWKGVDVPAGKTVERSFQVKVDESLSSDAVIKNKATATFGDTTKTSNETQDKCVVPRPDLSVVKTSNRVNQQVTEGSTVRYTITVTNNGQMTGSDTIVDKLPQHLDLVESSLPSGASYDKSSRTIKIPVTVGAGQKKSYSFNAKLQAKSKLSGGTKISNTATLEKAQKSSTTTILYKVKNYSLSLQKAVTGQTARNDLGEDMYEISYRVTVTNKGGPLWAKDGEKIVDTMSGGLIPLDAYGWADSKTEGTIRGTWTSAANSGKGASVSASVTKQDLATSDQYVSTWPIGDMKAGEKATLDYKAVAYLPDGVLDTANLTNVAQIYKLGNGSGVSAKPQPVSDKYILTVNGEEPANTGYCEINPGDVVTYRLKIENKGYATQPNVLLTDALPDYNRESGFQWKIGENVSISGTFGGNMEHADDSAGLVWRNVSIPAQSVKTVDVTVTFPKGAMFDRAFSDERATVYNTFTLQTADGKIKQTHKVKHDTVPVELSVGKKASSVETMLPGETISFELSPSDVEHPVSGLTLSDNVEALAGNLSVTSVYTGSFSISGKNSYTLRLTYSGGKAPVNITVAASGQTVNLTDEQKKDLVSVDWVFGDVDSLRVNTDPKLTMTAEDVAVAFTGKNYVNYRFNDRVAGDDDSVSLMPKDMLVKTAYKGDYPVTNPDGANDLGIGDKVEFRIEYKNRHGKDLDMSKVTLLDVLATEGLEKASDVKVTMEHYDADNKKVNNTNIKLETDTFGITQQDIDSPMAKRIELKFSGGTLKEGEKLLIKYTVTTGDGFINSMADYNMGIDEDGVYDGKKNLASVHNEVFVTVNGQEYGTETGFYYMEGEPQLYFMKGQRSERYIASTIKGMGRDGHSLHYSIMRLLNENKEPFGTIDTESRSFTFEDGADIFNYSDSSIPVIEYSMTIYNDAASPEAFTVESLTDQLPEGATFIGGAYAMNEDARIVKYDYSNIAFDMFLKSKPYAQSFYTGDYSKYSSDDYPNVDNISTAPGGKGDKVRDNYVKVTPEYDQTDNKVTFKITEENGGKVVLQPGERIAFYYGVMMDNNVVNIVQDFWGTITDKYYDKVGLIGVGANKQYTNSAQLRIDKEHFRVRDDLQIKTVNCIDFKKIKQGLNDGDCTQVSANTFESSVTVKETPVQGGIQKKAVARYDAGSMTDAEFMAGYKDNTLNSDTDMKKLGFGDIVQWEITIRIPTYMKSLYMYDAVSVQDIIPYPYNVVSADDGTNLLVEYNGEKWIKGQITDEENDVLGARWKVLTFNPSKSERPKDEYATMSGSPDTLTLTYFTRYDSAAPLAYMNFDNEARMSIHGRPLDEAISGWGEPVRDENGNIQYVKAIASVFPGASEMSQSFKKIEYKPTNDTANSMSDPNKITVPRDGEEVTYTSTLHNSGNFDYDNLVIIDRLPDVGDTGTVNSVAERGSEFGVELVKGGSVKVLIDGKELAPEDYEITYTSQEKKSGYTEAEWAGDKVSGWTSDPNGAKSVRVKLNTPLPGKSKLEIVFDAYLTEEADPGEIAWASFGYRYKNTEKSQKPIYAEPAKVGVQLPSGTVSVTKKASGSNELLSGAEFSIYTDADCKKPYTVDGAEAKMTTGSDGNASFDKLALETDYWIKETKAPENYTASATVYNVRATSANPSVTIGTNGTVVNEPEKKTGKFTVTKQVVGETEEGILGGLFDKAFAIKVSGKFSDGNTEKTYHLKNNEYATVENTIFGETYTVREELSDDYTVEYSVMVGANTESGNSVTMGEEDVAVLVENSPVKDDALYITKSVNGASGNETYTVYVKGKFQYGADGQVMTKNYTFTPEEYGKLKEVEGAIPGEEYTITERSGNYTAVVKVDEKALTDENGAASNVVEFADSGKTVVEVVNTELTSVSGEKTWVDGDDADGTRPTDVTVELYQKVKGDSGDGQKYDEQSVSAGDDGTWKYTFEGLPKYDSDGNEYEYSVKEKAVDGYKSTVTGNDIENTLMMDLSGEKTWNDGGNIENTRPASITVNLYQNGGDKPYKSIKVQSGPEGAWKYTFTDLPKYDEDGNLYSYTVKEEGVPDGYTVEYPGDGMDPATDGYDIDIVNSVTTSIEGEKLWKNDDIDISARPAFVTIDLLQNGELLTQTTAEASTGWKYNFDGLPKYDADGKLYKYTVKESSVPALYTAEAADDGYDITNIYVGVTSVSGEKSWNDGDNADGTRPEEITVKLYQKVKGAEGDPAEYGSKTVTAADDWKYTFADLPKYDTAGDEYEYTVKEESVSGYSTVIDGYDIANTKLTSVSGEKSWNDGDDADGTRPEEITVKLYQKVKGTEGEPTEYDSKIVTAADDWKYTFAKLPKYDTAGAEYEYTVKEEAVSGYSTEIDGYDITNTKLTSVSGEKIWNDGSDADGTRPEEITVKLYQKVKGTEGEPAEYDSRTVTAADDWKYTFADLPKYDTAGAEYEYTVKEEAVNGYSAAIDGYDITNTKLTSVSGEKTWKNEANRVGEPIDSIIVNLYQSVGDTKDLGKKIDEMVVTAHDNWAYEFNDLPEYDNDGNEYTYTVREANVPEGYVSEIYGTDITNTYVGNLTINGEKKWNDGDDADESRPDSIEVTLYQKIEGADGDGAAIDTKTVTAADDWRYEFTGLRMYDMEGNLYEYTVKETPVEGYSTEIDGYNITNTKLTSVSGEKIWNDDDDADDTRPEEITVKLYQKVKGAEGEPAEYDSKTVTAADDWKYTFAKLPKYDTAGAEYEYTVKEEAVSGYSTAIDGYDITNTKLTSVSGEKIWNDNNDANKARPDTVTIDLLRNGEKADSIEVSAEDGWKYTFADLPKYDAAGDEYEYTVEEADVPDGYEATVDGYDITNTYESVAATQTGDDSNMLLYAITCLTSLVIICVLVLLRRHRMQ